MGTLLGLMVAIAILYGIPRLVQRHNQQIIHELWERQKKAELRAEEEKQKRLWDEDKKRIWKPKVIRSSESLFLK